MTKLKAMLGRIADLNGAAAVLEWDQETYMPPGGTEARAFQIGTLRELGHEFFIRDSVGELLDQLSPEDFGPGSSDAALLRVTRRDYDRARKIPARLVADMARATAFAKDGWKKARDTNTYAHFAPHLQTVIDLNVEKAEAVGYDACVYDALLDEYEPGMKTATVAEVFANLRDELVPFVREVVGRPQPDTSVLHRFFADDRQWDFGLSVIRDFGYDFEHGRQDRSAHPFTTTFALSDVRITTRVDEHFLNPALFGTLHEAGHGMYEQGIATALDRTPLASGTSLGMHESQSRLWENLVGRSLPFWEHYYPSLQRTFPEALGDTTLDAFYRATNAVAPSLIRVEADEVTYNLHIMLRFELEQALVDRTLSVDDLPTAWNEKTEAYFGLRPASDTEGVLQDIHWSLGALGYFPTYALGNLMSAQFFNSAVDTVPDLENQIARGEFGPLLAWLRENVHKYGRMKTATEILESATGRGLEAESWVGYVREKFGALYGL